MAALLALAYLAAIFPAALLSLAYLVVPGFSSSPSLAFFVTRGWEKLRYEVQSTIGHSGSSTMSSPSVVLRSSLLTALQHGSMGYIFLDSWSNGCPWIVGFV